MLSTDTINITIKHNKIKHQHIDKDNSRNI
jgi:hypothetical protein